MNEPTFISGELIAEEGIESEGQRNDHSFELIDRRVQKDESGPVDETISLGDYDSGMLWKDIRVNIYLNNTSDSGEIYLRFNDHDDAEYSYVLREGANLTLHEDQTEFTLVNNESFGTSTLFLAVNNTHTTGRPGLGAWGQSSARSFGQPIIVDGAYDLIVDIDSLEFWSEAGADSWRYTIEVFGREID